MKKKVHQIKLKEPRRKTLSILLVIAVIAFVIGAVPAVANGLAGIVNSNPEQVASVAKNIFSLAVLAFIILLTFGALIGVPFIGVALAITAFAMAGYIVWGLFAHKFSES